jgi:hypothetical protein
MNEKLRPKMVKVLHLLSEGYVISATPDNGLWATVTNKGERVTSNVHQSTILAMVKRGLLRPHGIPPVYGMTPEGRNKARAYRMFSWRTE